MILWDLFWTFLVVGFLSFGGGYAMIPVIGHQVEAHSWMTVQEYTDIIAVAGISPGPIATNTAIFVGYRVDGLPGALAAALGMTLPSFLIIIAVAAFFYRMHRHPAVKASFYILRPVITALILYGGIKFAVNNELAGGWASATAGISAVLLLLSFVALTKFRMHPFYVIVLSGAAGIAIYA